MKAAVVGNGNVGLATFRILLETQGIHEVSLIGRNVEKVEAEIADYEDSFVLGEEAYPTISYGSYEQVAGADIIIYTSGVAQKPGQSRLDLLKENIKIADNIFTEINKYNKDSIIIVISNPVDILTNEIARISGRPRSKVIGTGTLLDTARCKRMLSQLLDISPKSLNLYVIGEHGDSSVVVMSSLRILGMTLDEYLSMDIETDITSDKDKIAKIVQQTAGKIIAKKGSTAYGVAAAAARIVSAIIHNEYSILPVSTVLNGEYGVNDMAISVPCLIGKDGIEKIMPLAMLPEEKEKFANSAAVLKDAVLQLNKE